MRSRTVGPFQVDSVVQGLDERPELAAARGHVHAFARMVCDLGGNSLPAWTDALHTDDLPALHALADGLQRDCQAVTTGLSLP
ncbi:hypothetical protein ACFY1U_33945 [Streptomyces sp. NPDC001351]|uniref:hypothetical protein n=1 Tax=Streptomyces sp. NPDC001351 TaxID=3364564 RepID=UPI0036BB32D4